MPLGKSFLRFSLPFSVSSIFMLTADSPFGATVIFFGAVTVTSSAASTLALCAMYTVPSSVTVSSVRTVTDGSYESVSPLMETALKSKEKDPSWLQPVSAFGLPLSAFSKYAFVFTAFCSCTRPAPCFRGEYGIPFSSFIGIAVLSMSALKRLVLRSAVMLSPFLLSMMYCSITAAAPAMCGDAMDVPLMFP